MITGVPTSRVPRNQEAVISIFSIPINLNMRDAATVLLLSLFLIGCADNGDKQTAGSDSALQGQQPVSYSAQIRGLEKLPDLQEIARASSRVFNLQARGAPSEAGLRRRADQDLAAIIRVLKSEGFYDAEARAFLETPPGAPVAVIFEARPNAQYMLGQRNIILEPAPGDAPDLDTLMSASGWETGAPARGETIIQGEAAVVAFLRRNGFPDARFSDRRAVAIPEDARLDLESRFDPGAFATFGHLELDPDSSLDADYVRSLIPWREGDPWNQKLVNDFQASLKATGLYARVSIKPDADAEGVQRPLVLNIENAKQRSVGGSLRYDTDQGPGVRVFWRHRNLFGEAEDFRAEADVSLREQKLSFGLSRPRHPSPRWTSNESLVLRRLDEDAFEEQSITARSGMEIDAGSGWVFGGSVEGSAALTQTDFEDETSYLVGLPLFARRNRTDDPLDATRGYKLLLSAGPYAGLNNGEFIQFGVVSGGGSVYVPLIGENRLVLALRTEVSSVLSQDIDDVPINQRLFAGGGASVRGFEFQSISPANAQNDLTGGQFLNENSIELRLRLGESFGIVGFADAGLVEEEPFPSFEEKLNVGVGGGFRYYSPVGPIRFDIAFPLDRRAGDNLFEFYISLGQAF